MQRIFPAESLKVMRTPFPADTRCELNLNRTYTVDDVVNEV